jgi:hypothetical protein
MFPSITSIATRHSLRKLFVVTEVSLGLLLCLLGINQAVAHSNAPMFPDGLGSIAGVVRNEQGDPLAGIRLILQQQGQFPSVTRIVTTTTTGVYTMPVLPLGIYKLQAFDPSGVYGTLYYGQEPSVAGAKEIPVAGNQVTNINFTLAPAAQVTGHVTILNEVTATNGNVTVYAQVDDAWAFVDSSPITRTGAYTIEHLPPGTFRFCASTTLDTYPFDGCYGGATPATATDVTVAPGETLANLVIVIGENQYNGSIIGTVTANGTPLTGIKVMLYRSHYPYSGVSLLTYALTDASGHYTLGGLPDGTYYLHFSDSNGVYAGIYYASQLIVDRAQPLRLENSTTLVNVNQALKQAGSIEGTVLTGSGQPLAHAKVLPFYNDYGWVALFTHAYPTSYPDLSSTTDDTGHYRLRQLWPGTYRICVQGLGPYRECYGAEESLPGQSDVDKAQDIVVQAGAAIAGIDLRVGPDHVIYLPLALQSSAKQ